MVCKSGKDPNRLAASTCLESAKETTVHTDRQALKGARHSRNLARKRHNVTAWTLENGVCINETTGGNGMAILHPTQCSSPRVLSTSENDQNGRPGTTSGHFTVT